MNRRTFSILSATVLLGAWAGPGQPATEGQDSLQGSALAPGSNMDFQFTVATRAPDRVWALWTSPESWADWDQGLRAARLTSPAPMRLGSAGVIQPLSGPNARFKVVGFAQDAGYAFDTRLFLAVLRVKRTFNADRSAFTHQVTFRGPAAAGFAARLGPGFRRALPSSMLTLNTLAESG